VTLIDLIYLLTKALQPTASRSFAATFTMNTLVLTRAVAELVSR
jgi:hypothetical protein